jgi:hypothetical protein
MVTMQRLECPICKEAVDTYCTINDRMPLCERCAVTMRAQILTVTTEKLLRGAAYGAGAALLMSMACGLAGYLEATNKDLSWLGYAYSLGSIFTGAVVGRAVSRGAGMCGGRGLQAIAIALSVLALLFAPFPVVAHVVHEQRPDLNAFAVFFVALIGAPLGYVGIIMSDAFPIAWLGFSVYDSWRRNKKPVLEVRGPFPVEQAAPAPAPAPAQAPPPGEARAAGMDFERPIQ